jgi:hypothetical protein
MAPVPFQDEAYGSVIGRVRETRLQLLRSCADHHRLSVAISKSSRELMVLLRAVDASSQLLDSNRAGLRRHPPGD